MSARLRGDFSTTQRRLEGAGAGEEQEHGPGPGYFANEELREGQEVLSAPRGRGLSSPSPGAARGSSSPRIVRATRRASRAHRVLGSGQLKCGGRLLLSSPSPSS